MDYETSLNSPSARGWVENDFCPRQLTWPRFPQCQKWRWLVHRIFRRPAGWSQWHSAALENGEGKQQNLKTSRPWSAQTNEWRVLTPADDANFENVATDHDFAFHVQLKAEVEGLHCEPSERGQHEVVHDGRHDLTTHSVLYFCHVVVDKETEVKQEHGCHELDENPCGFTGLGPPAGRDEQIVHILWRKIMQTSNCVHLHSSSLIWPRHSF